MGYFGRECDATEEAALKGIYKALERLSNKNDIDAPFQCDKEIAICCYQLASVYGTSLDAVIQWLCNPWHCLTPESVAAFVKEKDLIEGFNGFWRHYSKQTLQRMRSIYPHKPIFVEIPKQLTSPEDPERSIVMESQELAKSGNTHHSASWRGGAITKEILVPDFDALTEGPFLEYNINSFLDGKTNSNDTTPPLASDSDVQPPRSPARQVLVNRGGNPDQVSWQNRIIGRIQGYDPAILGTDRDPMALGTAKILQGHEPWLAPASASYNLGSGTSANSRQLPLIRDSTASSPENLHGTPLNAQSYHGYPDDGEPQAKNTLLPGHIPSGEKALRTRVLADWAVVSKAETSNGSHPACWASSTQLQSPLRNQSKEQLSLPVSWPSPSQWSTSASTAIAEKRHCPPSSSENANFVAQRFNRNSNLNTLAEKCWPQLLPEDLMTNLALVHTQRTGSCTANFGQSMAFYKSEQWYQCPFKDGNYSSSFFFLRHLIDTHSTSRLLKTYDAHDELTLVCRPKALG